MGALTDWVSRDVENCVHVGNRDPDLGVDFQVYGDHALCADFLRMENPVSHRDRAPRTFWQETSIRKTEQGDAFFRWMHANRHLTSGLAIYRRGGHCYLIRFEESKARGGHLNFRFYPLLPWIAKHREREGDVRRIWLEWLWHGMSALHEMDGENGLRMLFTGYASARVVATWLARYLDDHVRDGMLFCLEDIAPALTAVAPQSETAIDRLNLLFGMRAVPEVLRPNGLFSCSTRAMGDYAAVAEQLDQIGAVITNDKLNELIIAQGHKEVTRCVMGQRTDLLHAYVDKVLAVLGLSHPKMWLELWTKPSVYKKYQDALNTHLAADDLRRLALLLYCSSTRVS